MKEAVLQKYLLASIVDFQHSCKENLNDYDLEKEQFNVELDNEIIEILSLGIAFHWLSAQALNRQHLKNMIHNKDYISYSPANLLKEIRTLRDEIEKEYRGRINTYSFRYGSFDTLKV
ncbi:hypothetical protein [uncultured Duncaniella sp.]|uniref:hypothetical protein n=1 Tax=uncultured Duncaniella sp. TaxID=2768039 RepID=UPI0026DFFCEB|nr:hypothetical protein [uncultured Duncaniella sp.]